MAGNTEKGAEPMKRSKRNILRQIALGLAIAAIIPATAQAQPIPYLSQGVGVDASLYSGQMSPDDRAFSKASTEQQLVVPYLSQGVGVDASLYGSRMSPDDRAVSKASTEQQLVIPYLSQGQGVTSSELGYSAVKSPDDRTFSKATSVGTAPVASGSGDRIDFNNYTVTGSLIALLLAMGAVIAVRHSRKGRLSPA
jgi:hypothetical protein